jgi:plastocyanin
MRFNGLALVASAVVLGACAGGDKNAGDTTSAASATAAATTPAAVTPAMDGAVAAAPITGKTYEVKMIGGDKGYRFEPNQIALKPGDGIKFILVDGGPHNVAFDPEAVPAESKGQLNANMVNQVSELSSSVLMNPGESYTVSFGNVKPGTYAFHCTPHLAMGMTGTVTVQ